MVYDINSCELEEISMNRHLDAEVHKQNGINSLKINPSRSLLATVGYTSNDIFVYELPTLKPIVLIKVRSIFVVICIYNNLITLWYH